MIRKFEAASKTLAISIAILVLAVPLLTTAKASSANEFFESAYNAAQTGNHQQAILLYAEGLRIDPTSLTARKFYIESLNAQIETSVKGAEEVALLSEILDQYRFLGTNFSSTPDGLLAKAKTNEISRKLVNALYGWAFDKVGRRFSGTSKSSARLDTSFHTDISPLFTINNSGRLNRHPYSNGNSIPGGSEVIDGQINSWTFDVSELESAIVELENRPEAARRPECNVLYTHTVSVKGESEVANWVTAAVFDLGDLEASFVTLPKSVGDLPVGARRFSCQEDAGCITSVRSDRNISYGTGVGVVLPMSNVEPSGYLLTPNDYTHLLGELAGSPRGSLNNLREIIRYCQQR